MARRLLVALTRDPLIARRAARVAAGCELQLATLEAPATGSGTASGTVPGTATGAGTGAGTGTGLVSKSEDQASDASATFPPPLERAAGAVIELELEGALELVRDWRGRWPELAIVGVLSSPRPELWREAELAGADAVCTRGTLERVLGERLADRLSGRRRARRLRPAPMSEFAGRLGFVGRVDQSPVGPIALFHLGGEIRAIADRCPHAGAALSEGELDGEVITCPRHGSQFRVTDGARVRGPADSDVQRFSVIVEGGVAFVELPA